MFKALSEMAEMVYAIACTKGWHPVGESEDYFIERTCGNIHDEVSELHTAWRNNELWEHSEKEDLALSYAEEELADIIIRVLDSAHWLGIDIGLAVKIKSKYNQTRSHRHGNKRS